MKATSLQIRLTFLGTVVETISSDALVMPLTIGTDETCAWRPPAGDRTMKPKTATLAKRGADVVLKAEKGVTFHVQGEVKTEHVLAAGDRLAIGDCEMLVGEAKTKRFYARYHRLEEVGGATNGRMTDIKADRFVIGSGEDAELRLKDDTVSRHHATIILNGDDTLVRDESSRNGTRVNGQRLGGKERLLKDGDILSFGPYEYRFLDRGVSHVRANTFMNVLIALLTVVVAGGGWYAFYSRTPDASAYLAAVQARARVERFEEADALLAQAEKARAADANRGLIRRQKERLGLWRVTKTTWDGFKKNLLEGNWDAARRKVGQLSLDRVDCWNWDADSEEDRMNEAKEAVEFITLEGALLREVSDPAVSDEMHHAIMKERDRLGVDKPDFAEDDRDWMKALKTHILDRVKAVDENVARYVALTNHLAHVDWLALETTSASNEIETVVREGSGSVRLFAHLTRRPFALLAADWENLHENRANIAAFDFPALDAKPVRTTPDDCAVSPALAAAQADLTRKHSEIAVASLELREILERLKTYGATLESDPPALLAFEDESRVEKALSCDVFTLKRPPQPERTAPADCEYDRLFGYGYLYSYIVEGYYTFPKEVSADELSTLSFHPVLRTLYEFDGEVKSCLKRLSAPEFETLKENKIAALIARLESWKKRYAAVRDRFDAIAREATGEDAERRGILARAVCLYLTEHEAISRDDWTAFNKRVLAHQKAILEKVDEIDPTKGEKTRQIIEWVIAHGIPGSIPVKRVWGQR